ncbi:MAG: hypothetical protein A3I02_14515 [Betaproteobacteria bacterium RIFCSPLOWO2_02_FULL_67_26]|nr:MAG: hypothetical protein A3I02_14515 [Betaproteobacteria bacterium RIFCSPLOWO2_02_FULL_67_26]
MCELRKRGLVTAVIVSEPFLKLGKTQARVLGVPDLPLLLIPHPLGGLSLEQVEGRAAHAIPQVLELIRGLSK